MDSNVLVEGEITKHQQEVTNLEQIISKQQEISK